MRAAYGVLTTDPAPASSSVSGIPVPTPPELFVEVAQLAPRLHLDSAQGWLRRVLDAAPPEEVALILQNRNASTRARAGYIAEVCAANNHAEQIRALEPIGAGPYYTGPRDTGGHFDNRWRVYDTGAIA
jgi:hypothetical protein